MLETKLIILDFGRIKVKKKYFRRIKTKIRIFYFYFRFYKMKNIKIQSFCIN